MMIFTFSDEECALILKALNFYDDHPEYHDNRGDLLNEMIVAFGGVIVERDDDE